MILEAAGEGRDVVISPTSWQLAEQVETLVLTTDQAANGVGNALNNVLVGGEGRNVLRGKAGRDRLVGNGGRDTLHGGSGHDRLAGGAGADTLIGGGGSDRFLFKGDGPFRRKAFGVDRIEGFSRRQDQIVLDRDVFTELESHRGRGFSDAADFAIVRGSRNAASSDAAIVYDEGNGNLFYNANGARAGFGGGGRFAAVAGAPAVSEQNFVVG